MDCLRNPGNAPSLQADEFVKAVAREMLKTQDC